MKKFLIVLLILVLSAAGAVYYFRNELFQYSAESVIRKNLPGYLTIKDMVFDLKKGRIEINGFGVKNPEGYSNKYIVWIDSVACNVKMKGKNLMDGIKVTDITARGMLFNIERQKNGRLNINDMQRVITPQGVHEPPVEVLSPEGTEVKDESIKDIDISKIISLSKRIDFSDSKIVFLDRAVSRRGHRITFENINGVVYLSLSDNMQNVLEMRSTGAGFMNGDEIQRIGWDITLDPSGGDLAMSNRFEVDNIDILILQPYYERYSPIDILKARFSGTLIFNFDHGNIGGMNTLHFRGLEFREKEGGGLGGWQASLIPEVIKYLQKNAREVTFDFKVSGPLDHPRFQLGPVVSKKIQAYAIQKTIGLFTGGEGAAGDGQTDADAVVNMLKGLFD